MSTPKYTLIPGVGVTVGLVNIQGLPECLPPPNLDKSIDKQGPIWAAFLDCWMQIHYYHGSGNPGANWRRNSDLFSQFALFGNARGMDVYSGIFSFLHFYKKLTERPDLNMLTDQQICNEIWNCVIAGRMHTITTWRVWDNWKA